MMISIPERNTYGSQSVQGLHSGSGHNRLATRIQWTLRPGKARFRRFSRLKMVAILETP